MPSIKQKILVMTTAALVLSATTFGFAVFHNEDGTDSVAFLLTNQDGERTAHQDLSVKPLLVFFGFTSCDDVCPIGLYKLANVKSELQLTNQDEDLTTVMITVDPERDTPEKLKTYLANFDESFIGLTGSRVALENAAAEFNTFLDKPPEHVNTTHHNGSQDDVHHATHLETDHGVAEFIENYQLTHSSVVYLVDTYSRVVRYISLDDDVDTIVEKLRKYLATQGQNHG